MKRFKFTMKDGYDGSIFEGNVEGEDWKEAWVKLSPLMKAGHKIIDIVDLDDSYEVETSKMSILHLVKKGEVPPGDSEFDEELEELEEEVELFFQVTFMLLSGDKIDVCARPDLIARINQWYNSDDEDIPPTISLMIEDTVMSLDRGFVGGVFVSPLNLDEDEEDANADPTEEHKSDGNL